MLDVTMSLRRRSRYVPDGPDRLLYLPYAIVREDVAYAVVGVLLCEGIHSRSSHQLRGDVLYRLLLHRLHEMMLMGFEDLGRFDR